MEQSSFLPFLPSPCLFLRLEIIDGGRACSLNREIRFPKLAEIIRLQLLRRLRNDKLRLLTQDIFESDRYKYMQEVYYPEMANQLHWLVTRGKISVQIPMAEKEFNGRIYPSSNTDCATSFAEMPNKELEKWLSSAKEMTQGPLKKTLVLSGLPDVCDPGVNSSHPPHPLAFWDADRMGSFPYTFIAYHDFHCNFTTKLATNSRMLRYHPSFLASKARLGALLPFYISPPIPSYFETDNADNVKKMLAFLSFATYKFTPPHLEVAVLEKEREEEIMES